MPQLPATESTDLALATQGDPEAFGRLVSPHLTFFFRVIVRILGNEAESQDALQDALIAMHRELSKFQGDSKFSTWGYRICVNQALMLRRKQMRRREDAIEDWMPQFEDDGHHSNQEALRDWSEEGMALVDAQRRQLRGRVAEALGRLTDDQRAVFVLRDLEDWDTDAIAERLGISRDLVRQRLHRARLALRSVLSDYLVEVRG